MRAGLRVAAAVVTLLAAGAAGAAAQLKDPTIGSRALTNADLQKHVAITNEVALARKGIKEISSPAGIQQVRAVTVAACARQGWGSLDYGVVNARVTAALLHIFMEATVPVPADKKAEVELVRKWKPRIEAAKRGQGSPPPA